MHTRKKKFRVLPTGVEPTTFRLLRVRMLSATTELQERLVGAKAIKLGSWDKHPAYC